MGSLHMACRHHHEARPRDGVRHGQPASRSEQRDLRSARAAFVRADGRLSLEHPDERVERRIDGAGERAAFGSSTSMISPAVPELDRRAPPTRRGRWRRPPGGSGSSGGQHLRGGLRAPCPCGPGSPRTGRRASRRPFPRASSSAPMPSACHTPRPVRIFRSDPVSSGPARWCRPDRSCDPCSRSPTGCTRGCRTRDGDGGCPAARSGVIGTTASCTRMNGSACSYGRPGRQRFQDVEPHHRPNVGVLHEDNLALRGLTCVVMMFLPPGPRSRWPRPPGRR